MKGKGRRIERIKAGEFGSATQHVHTFIRFLEELLPNSSGNARRLSGWSQLEKALVEE